MENREPYGLESVPFNEILLLKKDKRGIKYEM